MSRHSPLARAALWYAAHGIPVFPLAPRSKRPLLRGGHGHLDASTDEATIQQLWERTPNANVGIACAAAGFVVADVDTYRNGDEALGEFERAVGPAPRTWEALARGRHIYFLAPPGLRFRGHLTTPNCGVEIKHAGFTVAPPSVHPTGIGYRWDAGWHPLEAPLAEIPRAWVEALRADRRPSVEAVGGARESFFGVAFDACGWLGADLRSGAICARCPWSTSHSDGRGCGSDSSTVILPPITARRTGRFSCAHAHCADRKQSDVLAALPRSAVDAAARRYPEAFGALVYHAAQNAIAATEKP